MSQKTHSVEAPADLFWSAHDQALFPQAVVAEILGLSPAWCERARWEGRGPKFLKICSAVRYRKKDVLDWLDQQQIASSTSELAHKPRRPAARD